MTIVALVMNHGEKSNERHLFQHNFYGIKIFDIDWLRKNDVDAAFLATNSKYYDQVRKKLKDINTELIPLLT